jgi:hypothetical protein
MQRPRLYVHIGTQKTGTTTIQNTLYKNTSDLKKEGIIYLGRYRKLAAQIRTIQNINQNLNNSFKDAITNDVQKYLNSNVKSFVISNEKFTGDKLIGYKNSNLIAKSLKKITENLGLDIYIIIYIRRQDDFFEATYSQRIFSGESYSFKSFLNKFDRSHFHWDELIESYSKVFGKEKIIVRRYDNEHLPHRDSLIHDFGEAINSNFLSQFEDTSSQNLGLTRNSLEILKIVNKHFNKKDRDYLRKTIKKLVSKDPYDGYSFFNSKDRKDFLSIYEESNKKVLDLYINDNSDKLFPEPDSLNEISSDYNGLTTTKAVILLSKILLKQNSKIKELNSDNSIDKKSIARGIITKLRKVMP